MARAMGALGSPTCNQNKIQPGAAFSVPLRLTHCRVSALAMLISILVFSTSTLEEAGMICT